jgi:hypothetical protein
VIALAAFFALGSTLALAQGGGGRGGGGGAGGGSGGGAGAGAGSGGSSAGGGAADSGRAVVQAARRVEQPGQIRALEQPEEVMQARQAKCRRRRKEEVRAGDPEGSQADELTEASGCTQQLGLVALAGLLSLGDGPPGGAGCAS